MTQPQGQQPAFDESKFINRDQFVVGLDFNAQMFDLSNEHAQLFTGVKGRQTLPCLRPPCRG